MAALRPVVPATGPVADTGVHTVTVVVCAYTERRWDTLVAALASLRDQEWPPDQVVVVVDHNEALLARCRASFHADVEVVANRETRGLAGARNSGIGVATGDVIAFLDDDAVADPGWLGALLERFDDPAVAGAGGLVNPLWAGGERPRWFPPEFDWVVGCSHRGLPEVVAPVRNPIGASMSMRRRLFDELGGFDTAMGRVGTLPLGCEETEFAVRASQHMAGIVFLHVPQAVVDHHVGPERARVGYFLRRCYAEGLSKAAVTRRAGAGDALSSERHYTAVTLPRAVVAGLVEALRGDPSGALRSAMVVAGLAAAGLGYGASLAVGRFGAGGGGVRSRRRHRG
ncbi:MAG: glycosyltransferase [Acidimicrobiales bacterium]|jgi:GT2 family glycosyltransferase